MKTIPAFLTTAVLCVALVSRAAAQSDERIVVPLSDPARPATLEVSVFSGDISVMAYDGNEVIILTRGAPQQILAGPNSEGLRAIPNASVGLTVEESNNTVSVVVDWSNRDVDLDISVPRRTSVQAGTTQGDSLTVVGVEGEHELSSVQGEITATDISGSAIIGTTNGDLTASFVAVTPDAPMSFTSFNGNVEVTFPESLAADLRISTGNGEVLTDFDFEMEPQAAVVDRSGGGGRTRIRVERGTHATVGGGGPELQFKTFNGNIVIRKR
jgi:DUF4097 and DUF4098 domain-containing protein YvlB